MSWLHQSEGLYINEDLSPVLKHILGDKYHHNSGACVGEVELGSVLAYLDIVWLKLKP